MSSANAKMNPFPGLRPFTQEEDYLFFGREEQTLELLQRLGSNRFVAVVGTSGSGKSSLVRCGLLSELLGGRMLGAGSAWEIAVTHPGGNPLALLTDSLLEADLYDRQEEHARENLLATLSRSHFGLVEAVKQADLGEGTNFLLVVDQFEEIFRFQDAGQRQQEVANEFISLLLEAVAQKEVPIYVVLTMRSDFIGECGQFEGLAEMVNRGEFLIPRLTREQYKRVIEGPIKVAGGQIAPRLLQRLLNDLGQQADQLPCLQHALMRTWDVWGGSGSGEALDLDDYQRIGRMAEALSLHADEIYESLASDRQRELCKGLFQALTVEESNNRGIRRPQRLGRLCQILEVPAQELVQIIEAYRESGVTFLMPSPEVELVESTIIDISHESLMRVWARLRQWVEEETQAAGLYHRLADSAALHELGKAGLYRDPELGIALAWQQARRPNAAWAERYRPGFAAAMAFLESSQQASVAEEQAREAARQRELAQAQRLAETERQRATDQARAAVRLRWMVRGLGLVAMVAIMATVFAWLARQEARRNADTALQAQHNTERALKEAEAAETLAKVNEAEAERQKAAAMSAEQRSREFRYATDIELAARMVNDKTANAAQLSDRLADFDPTMNKSLVATNDMRGFEWYYLKKLVDSRSSVFSGFNKPVIAAAVTSDGVLITLDEDAQVRRFDAATKQERGAPTDLKKGRNIVARTLSPDAQRVAIAIGNEVQIFDAGSGEQIGRSIPVQVRGGVIFSPDSRMLITMDTSIGWWDVESGKPIAVQDFQLTIFSNPLQPLSTSADGLTLAVGGQGTYRSAFSVFKLNPETREITRLLDKIGAQGTKRAMAISPDGAMVSISLYFQGGIYVYETATGKLLQSLPSAHSSAISAIAFRKDSAEMVTASLDGTIKLWKDYRKLDPDEANTFIGHAEEVNLLSILPGDKQLLSASSDKTVRVWNLGQSKAEFYKKLAGANGSPRASFSSDGRLIATPGGLTGNIAGNRLRIWDAATGQPAMEFPEGSRSDLSADSVAFSPDGRLLAAGFGGIKDVSYIELWDFDRRERIGVLPGSTAIPGFTTDENSGTIPGLAFSPDGKHLVATFGSMNLMSRGDTGNFPLLVYDVATRQVVRRLEGHRNFCMAVTFSRDGSRMASASQDGTARIWDTATWRELKVLDNPDTASEAGQRRVYDVAFSPNDALLAMASAEGNVILFDVASGEVLQKLRGHANEVQGVAFAPDGRTLASGSRDGTIRFWNTATWRELLRLEPEEGFTPYSISFSPNGERLLASAFGIGGTLLWSIPRDGSTSGTTTEELARLLDSNIDFRHRIRLISNDLQLHEPLAILAQRDPNRAEVNAALAATRAHWHAERSEWGKAVEQFDQLKLLSPEAPQDWLRTPGLLRLATALFHGGRSADAAALLIGGEGRRAEDGNGTRSDSFGFAYDASSAPAKLTRVFRGSPAWNGGLRVGDAMLKINDIEVKSENRAKYQESMQNPVERKLSISFQHPGNHQLETAEVIKASYIQDDLTAELIESLLAAVSQKLSESANDPGLLELRAELAGQSSDHERQVADYTSALDALSDRPKDETSADLQRLYGRRGNAHVALGKWRSAIEDYAQAITDQTTDEVLLANQALAQAEVSLGAWSVLKPTEIRSEGGATLTLLKDGSILSSGKHPDRDDYIVTAPIDVKNIRAIALDVLPHESLGGNIGRGVTGQFIVTEMKVFGLDNAGKPQPIQLNDAVVDYAQVDAFGNWDGRNVINGNAANLGWNVQPQYKDPHRLVMKLDQSIADGTMALMFVIQQHHFNNYHPQGLLLGRFRLSVSDDPDAFDQALQYFTVKNLTDPWQKLAAAYRMHGDQQAIDSLVARRPQSAGPIGDLFIDGEDKNWQRAIEIYSKGITPETTDAELFTRRAKAYEALKDWNAAVADWESAARSNPDGAKILIDFAQRLANSDQPALTTAVRGRALRLLEEALSVDPENVVAVEQMAGLLLERDQHLEFGLASLDQDAMTRITALRVETSSDASPPAGNDPPFTEYQILSTKLPEQGFRGRFVRLDLPGESRQFPRFTKDGEKKHINLSELQIFQGDLNIALNKKATASSGEGDYAPQRAVDGNTDGNDTTHSYAHTWDVENPWWEVDLGSEQAFDRMIVWNRTDIDLYPRMNHFRVQILDANRELVYERVIDQAPAPSTEIRRSVNWSHLAATVASESSVRQLNFGLEKDSVPPERIRVSATAEVLRETTAERANDADWVKIPNALNTQLTGSLALDAQTLAKIAQQSRLAQASKIADAPTRLAAAYELVGKLAASAKQFRRTLDRSQTDAARDAVLKVLSNYPEALADLVHQRPGDPQLQIALVRRHVAMGHNELEAKEPKAALIELQKARDLFERLLKQNAEPRWTVLQPTEMTSEGGATLTLQEDGSVLASGENPDEDTYTLKAESDLTRITGFRLEALPHPSLPKNGPGRAGNGNFHLNELRVFSGVAPLALTDIAVSYNESSQIRSMIDGKVDRKLGWSIDPKTGQTSVAIIAAEPDIKTNDPLRFELFLSRYIYKKHNLGRFRLSATGDPNAFTAAQLRLLIPQAELATLDISIGKAYAQQGKVNDSVIAFARALDRFEKDEKRQKIIETMKDFPTELSLLAERRPQDTPLQLALAKSLAEGGQKALAENRQDEALQQLAKARELFASLAAKHPEAEWTVLQPTEMKSEVGAQMDLQADGSVFVHQVHPAQNDTYTLVLPAELKGIKGLRLEALADSRLPRGGPGWKSDYGNFVLSKLSLQANTSHSVTPPRWISLQVATADFAESGFTIASVIASNSPGWAINPQMNQDHTAVFELAEKFDDCPDSQLIVRLHHEWSDPGYVLGRFRLSVTSDSNAVEAAQFQQDLKASGLMDLDAAFAKAYAQQGRLDEAAGSYARVLDLAVDLQARAKTISEAATHAGVLEKLAVLKTEDAPFLDTLARHYQQQGELSLARDAAMKARALYEAKLVAQPQDSKLAGALADLLLEINPVRWTVLTPTEMISEVDAKMELQEDGSIFVHHAPPLKNDTYTLVFQSELEAIAGLRLEVFSDTRLPGGGPGLGSDGNFLLSELTLQAAPSGTPDNVRAVALRNALADFSQTNCDVRGAIDGSTSTSWGIFPEMNKNHTAFFELAEKVGDVQPSRLTVRLNLIHNLPLGRFRLSVSDELGFQTESKRLAAKKLTQPWSRLGAAYRALGESDKALTMFARLIELAGTDQAKATAAQEAAPYEDIFSQLLERFPNDKSLRLGQAKYLAAQHTQQSQFQAAVDVLSGVLVDFPDDIDLLNQRAGAHMKLAQWQAAYADYARILELETDNGRRRVAESLLAEVQLRLGNFQAGADGYFERMLLNPGDEWALRDAATAQLLTSTPGISQAVARRFLEKSGASKNKDLAQWLVRILVARPGLITKENSPKLLEAAKIAESPWTEPMTAAIHYRLGDLQQAEPLLTKANGDIQLQALAAMLLYDQGKTDEARALLSNSSAWLDRERLLDPGSVIPVQQAWQTWAVNAVAWREAARKLIGPRITELDELLAKEPDSSADLIERAELLTNVGLFDEALRDLQPLVTENVTSPESLALHGRILARLGRDEEALPLLNQAIADGSQDSDVYAARGTLLVKQRQADAARVDLEKSIELKPNAVAAHSLADLLLAQSGNSTAWTVLKPGEVNSENGEQFALEEDGSIFVSGPIPQRAVYTIRWRTEVPEVACLRIETLPDARLTSKGAGRATNGNFHLAELTLAIAPQESGGMATTIEMANVIADDQTSDDLKAANIIDGNPNTRWDTYPRQSTRHAVVLKLKSPIRTTDKELTLTLDSGVFEYGPHALGRFRLSVGGDPASFASQQKLFAAMMITDPWAKLAAAYQAIGDQQALDKLLEGHPSAATGIGDLYAADKNWEQAIAAYSKLIGDETTDASLLIKRGEAYFALKQFDLARADWRGAVALRPELAQSQFDRLRLALRWSEAAEFGLLLIGQRPEDTMLWVQVPPVAVLADHDTIYPEVCRAILELFRKAPTPENFDRGFKACLLKPGAIDMAKLPLNLLSMKLDDGKVPDYVWPWIWSTRALLAYRTGDAELAVKNVNQSEGFTPSDPCHAMNLAVLIMAQHDLKHPEEARTALNEGLQLLTKLQANNRHDHDTLIAEILLREAEVLMNGKEQPKESASEEK